MKKEEIKKYLLNEVIHLFQFIISITCIGTAYFVILLGTFFIIVFFLLASSVFTIMVEFLPENYDFNKVRGFIVFPVLTGKTFLLSLFLQHHFINMPKFKNEMQFLKSKNRSILMLVLLFFTYCNFLYSE